MALTDQPYYPKYVDDYLTDEKLLMCDSSSEGVYNRILCHMHKSDSYGKLIISDFEKAKFKQKLSKTEAKPELKIINVDTTIFLMYVEKVKSLIGREYDTVYNALFDLIGNGVLRITDGVLWQKRMFEDGQKSISKANNGKKGGEKRKQNLSNTEAKIKQNPVNGVVIEDVNEIEVKDEIVVEPKEIDHEKIISIFNSVCKNLPTVQKLTKSRKSAINARITDYNLSTLGDVFQKVATSNFLNGENDRNWTADFDWIMNPNNFIKILEGKYNSKQRNKNWEFNAEEVYQSEAAKNFKFQ